jgi:hypothetical protein
MSIERKILVNMVMNLWVPYNVENYLNDWQLLKKDMLYGVSLFVS